MKVVKPYTQHTILLLKKLYFKTDHDVMYKQLDFGFKFMIDFAGKDVGLIRLENKSFYITIKQLEELNNEVKNLLKVLENYGVIET